MRLEIGDCVVYPAHGAGKIIGMTTRRILGEVKEYLELELIHGTTKILIPVGSEGNIGLRAITDKARVPEIIELLRGPDADLPEGWNPRNRMELEIIAAGDIFEIARLVGTLFRRDGFVFPLSITELEVLGDAKHMVATELALSLGMELADANAMILRAMA